MLNGRQHGGVSVTIATSLEDACAALAVEPCPLVLSGGTDLMVEVNRGSRRVGDIVVVNRVPELVGWRRKGDQLRLGAAVTFAEICGSELESLVPALAQAARTVGSPQIRNVATLGGNIATASPAGDSIPVLAALDAVLELRSAEATREVSLRDFITGVKQTCLLPGELIEAVRVPVLDGPQEFCKVGTRNAMVISVASLAILANRGSRRITVGLGSVSPAPLRASDAEDHISPHINWDGGAIPDEATIAHFARLVAGAANPIDDHRSSALYRTHAIRVLARRALSRVLGRLSAT
ncbi:MAG TPA: carbon monoxide dehydrogenase [Acidimicrobiaceae bacterium]|nr:carbon monoxide dehydrogenase [Acidimicrobiaceae bacterium]MDP7259028.1 xanthine dehydrogenase family protein subunit M [Acidimicrobiales bacterium]HCV35406.1 carbon monoxide dehydrogenase [Acidimicrobiaceae bacterium]HJO79074.1 xanthine dehydrogenase family protein subunit M [Acidimicrobiales bacterium]